MKPLSLKKRIENYLRKHGDWMHKGDIETLSKNAGFLGDNGGRRCRELVEEGILEKKEEKGSVLYRYKKRETIINVPIFTENGTVKMEQRSLFK